MPDPVQPSLVRSLGEQPFETAVNPDMKHKKYSLPKILLIFATVVVVIAVAGYFFIFTPSKKLITTVYDLKASTAQVGDYIKTQDLPATKDQLNRVRTQLDTLNSRLDAFAWTKPLPFIGAYYQDGKRLIAAAGEMIVAGEITIDAIAPYADIIGLKGLSTTGDGAKTAQDRINFILNTLDKIKPQLTQIGEHLAAAQKQVDQIDPARYPEQIRGYEVRSQLVKGISLIDQASSLVNDAKPLMESAPYMLGIDSARKYLVIFHNDAELRPTGGFMTAYAILSIDKGKISIIQSDDIYQLDAKFTKKIAAPDPIKKYLPNVPYWYLRDQNLSPDFKVSMDTFYPNYLLTGSPKVDGIIMMDTQVLVDMLKITGPIGVSGFGNYSAELDKRCNCPQVFYELELFADVEGPVVWDSVSGEIIVKPQNYGQRKSFIGPMMHSVLSNVMAQPKSKMGDLFQSAMSLIAAKHIQFYYTTPEIQQAVETFNMAGRVTQTSGDYLMVVDTNFAGAKTNAWVTYDAEFQVDIASDGTTTNTLTLTYKNPQQYFQDEKTKLKLNGLFRDWLRIYIPKGSQLIETKGFETGEAAGEDLEKTVIEGFFTLAPQNVKTITIKYQSAVKSDSQYKLLIQKQAGSKSFPYEITVNGKRQPEFVLSADKNLTISF